MIANFYNFSLNITGQLMLDISLLQIPSSTISVAVFCDTTRTMKGKLTDFGTPRLLTIPPHKFWDQSPSPHYQCCLQVSETVSWRKLPCCYSANMLQHLVGGRVLIYSRKVDHSRISINFSRNRLGLNSFCGILSQHLRNLSE